MVEIQYLFFKQSFAAYILSTTNILYILQMGKQAEEGISGQSGGTRRQNKSQPCTWSHGPTSPHWPGLPTV